MYATGYSQVSKSSPRAQKKMQYRSKGKSCGYYMRIVFFFSSLIQSLIIVSLVLFLVYGKTQDSASMSRNQDMEESFSRLSIENVALRQQRKNLTNLLNTTLTEKARNDWDLAKLRYFSNISAVLIQDMDKKLQQTYNKLILCESTGGSSGPSLTTFQLPCNCGLITERMKAGLALVESNFTQTVQRMRMDLDQTAKERDSLNLEAIRLRRDKSTHEKEVDFFKQKCKDDFTQSLSGISDVSKAFLDKINVLFPAHIAFQLTCKTQMLLLEQIRTNCTSLSEEVQNKFQRYLNVVGEQVSTIQAENSRMKAENGRLFDDYRDCSLNRSGLIRQHRQNLDKLQGKHDEEKEKLLMDKMRLNGDIEVLTNNVRFKSRANDHLTEQIKQLNMSCVLKPGFGGFLGTQSQLGLGLGGSRSVPSGSGSPSWSPFNKPASTGTGSSSLSTGSGSFSSSGSAYNKPVSTGTGSSSSSTGSGSPSWSPFNKPASTGTGSSSSSTGSGSSSSSGSAYNKPASTGTGSSSSSTGSGSSSWSLSNKPASTGTGSSSSSTGSGSSSGSAYNKPASTGTGSSSSSTGSGSSSWSLSNKPASTGTGSSSSSTGSGSSSSSWSLSNKPASTGTGSSSSSTGSGSSSWSLSNKPASTGTGSSSSSTGSGSSSSSGSAYNKPASTGTGSSSSSTGSGSSSWSLFNKPASTGTGSVASNKPVSSAKSSTGLGSSAGSTGSTGSTNKSGSSSTGYSWFGGNSGQSKTGSGTGRGPSTGNSGGPGSDAGRPSGSISVAQHLKDLQRIINPPGPEEKQDISRMLG